MQIGPGRYLGRSSRPGWRRLLTAAIIGAAVALGQAPWSLWWVSVPALSLLTALVAGERRPAQAVWLGWAGGAGYFAACLFWIVEPFLIDIARHGWMAPFALVLMSCGMALFWAAAAGVSALGANLRMRALGFAAGLAAADLLRGYLFTGFPWALIGHIWIDTPVAQAAALFGAVGLTALTALAAALPVLARETAGRLTLAAVAVLALAGVWMAGQSRLAAPEMLRDPAIRVRLIQPNAAQELKWRGDMWRVFVDRQMAMTAEPAEQPLDLVIWPETAVPFLLDDALGLFEEIAGASGGVPAAIGIQRNEGLRYFNSLAFADETGQVVGIYDKWHLVPFGEYVPFGDFMADFGVRAFASREGMGYTAGPGARLLNFGRAGMVLPLICYEAVFPQDLRAAPARPDWVLQVTNDGWFGKISGPYQHLAQARLRAIEQGLPVLRAANTGVSAVIDAKGRIGDSLGLGAEGFIDSDVPAALPPTFYSRSGDLPVALILGATIALFFFRRRGLSD